MSTAMLISRALSQQVYLSADGDNLRLVFDKKPDPELLDALKANKPQVLAELKRLQRQWLERVAHTLHRPPEWLLQHGIIDTDDVRELWHTEPREAAKTAKTGLNWNLANH